MDNDLKKIKLIRDEIDRLDKLLLTTIKERFKLVERISLIKKKLGLTSHQKNRWESMMEARLKLASRLSVDPGFTNSMFKLIHKESKRLQTVKRKEVEND